MCNFLNNKRKEISLNFLLLFYTGDLWDSHCEQGIPDPWLGEISRPQGSWSALCPAKEQKSLVKKIEALENHRLNTEEPQEASRGSPSNKALKSC